MARAALSTYVHLNLLKSKFNYGSLWAMLSHSAVTENSQLAEAGIEPEIELERVARLYVHHAEVGVSPLLD